MTPEDFKSKKIKGDGGIIVDRSRYRELLSKEERLVFFEAATNTKPGFSWPDFILGFATGAAGVFSAAVARVIFNA